MRGRHSGICFQEVGFPSAHSVFLSTNVRVSIRLVEYNRLGDGRDSVSSVDGFAIPAYCLIPNAE